MKRVLLILCFSYLFISNGQAQVNAEIIGKTITDSIVIKDGASTGFILQSVDATGLGEWVSPGIFGVPDNLGNHSATMDLIINGFGIEQTNHLQFVTGAIYLDDGAMGLNYNGTQINYGGAQLLRANSVNFQTGATYVDDGAMGLEFSGTQINYGGAQLLRANSVGFQTGATYVDDGAMGLEFFGDQINYGGAQLLRANSVGFLTGATYTDDGSMGLEFTGAKINYGGAQLIDPKSVKFLTGATYTDDGGMGLEFSGTQINYGGAQLQNAESLSFALSGGDSYIREVPGVGGFTPTEIHLWSNSMAPVPVGIGGPVNPPAGGPIASVLGNAGMPVMPGAPFMLGVHGDAWATDWYAISDARFKKNIIPIRSSLDKVKRIKAFSYNLDKDKFDFGEVDDAKTIGFLAQDLAKIIPEAVKVNANGVYLVRYNALIPVLTQAISELDDKIAENDALQREVNELKKCNVDMLSRIEKLELKSNQN